MKKIFFILIAITTLSSGCFFHSSGPAYGTYEVIDGQSCQTYITEDYYTGYICEETWCYDSYYDEWYLYDEYCY